MAYGNFNNYEDVAEKFDISFVETSFLQEKSISIHPEIIKMITDNLATRRNYVSESSICETIISPILTTVAKQHQLPVWSHIRFDVSESEGLCGIPDYLIAPSSSIGTRFTQPIICIAEAKKENFNEGWAQVLTEMIAAQRFNQDEQLQIDGIVTTGNFWQFAKLKGKIFTMETVDYSALENFNKLLNILNWIFFNAKNRISL
jgi:hypothetical protein